MLYKRAGANWTACQRVSWLLSCSNLSKRRSRRFLRVLQAMNTCRRKGPFIAVSSEVVPQTAVYSRGRPQWPGCRNFKFRFCPPHRGSFLLVLLVDLEHVVMDSVVASRATNVQCNIKQI